MRRKVAVRIVLYPEIAEERSFGWQLFITRNLGLIEWI